MTCPLCGRRKAKRTCPALGREICAVCCGTKRLVEIQCPATCGYLETAQRHPAAAVKRQHDHDLGVLMTTLGRVSQAQLQLFFLIQSLIARFAPPPDAAPVLWSGGGAGAKLADTDVAEAAGALASTLETASRGVLYDHRTTSPIAEALKREMKALLDEVGRGGGSRFEREAAEVLRGIERGARHDAPGLNPGAHAYLTLVARVLQEGPAAVRAAPSLILP